MPTKEDAEVFCVSRARVRRAKQCCRERGGTGARKMGGPGPIEIDRERLAESVREWPDAAKSSRRCG